MVKRGPEAGFIREVHPRTPDVNGAVLLIPGVAADIPSLTEFDITLKNAGYLPVHAPDIATLGIQEGYEALNEQAMREDVHAAIGVGRGGLYAVRLAQDLVTSYAVVLNAPVNGMKRPLHGATSIYTVNAEDGSGFQGSATNLFTGDARSPLHNPTFTNIPMHRGTIFGDVAGKYVVDSLQLHQAVNVAARRGMKR